MRVVVRARGSPAMAGHPRAAGRARPHQPWPPDCAPARLQQLLPAGGRAAVLEAARFGDGHLALVGVAIYAVLAILLRNLLATVYLLGSVGLSTAAAIGGVGLLCRVLANQPLYWAVPVFAFVFLVAMGEDFNIYLVSRLREQLSEAGRTEEHRARRGTDGRGDLIGRAGRRHIQALIGRDEPGGKK